MNEGKLTIEEILDDNEAINDLKDKYTNKSLKSSHHHNPTQYLILKTLESMTPTTT